MHINERLQKLGLTLPEVSTPGGSYKSVNTRKDIAYLAIQFPIRNGEYMYQGRLGDNLTTDDGILAMELCALNAIAQLEDKIGLDKVIGLNHIEGYYQVADHWDDGPTVVDGASKLFIKLLGEKGEHSRSIFGVQKLPRNFCAGLTVSATLL